MNEEQNQKTQQTEAIEKLDTQQVLMTIISRNEATKIIVDVINAIIDTKKNSGQDVSEDIITSLQNVINAENNKTNSMLAELQAALNPSNVVDLEEKVEDKEAKDEAKSNN